eukprot:SAG11_NODE_4220_length_2005_cov_1.769150_2_plen_143_part_00
MYYDCTPTGTDGVSPRPEPFQMLTTLSDSANSPPAAAATMSPSITKLIACAALVGVAGYYLAAGTHLHAVHGGLRGRLEQNRRVCPGNTVSSLKATEVSCYEPEKPYDKDDCPKKIKSGGGTVALVSVASCNVFFMHLAIMK